MGDVPRGVVKFAGAVCFPTKLPPQCPFLKISLPKSSKTMYITTEKWK
jgi:hypothetical protein